jgi:lipopolysaccharide heptosyltransferase I
MSHPNTHRFVIVRLGSLGDVIHAIPVAAALRERYPAARIDWLVDPRYVDMLGMVKGLNAAIPVDTRRPLALLSTIAGLRRVRYTAAIDLQGLLKSAVIARLAGGWQTIGFPREHLRESTAGMFYTDRSDPGDRRHVVFKNLALLKPLGIQHQQVSFPLKLRESDALDEAQARAGERYALVNPGAAWPNKRWPADRFGALATAIHKAHGLRSLVLWGPGEEKLASAVVDASAGAADLSPATSIVDLFAIASRAAVLVSGDTGPLHIAGAVGTPVVALFGPTYSERNGPWSGEDITVSRTDRCSCLYKRKCRTKSPCMQDIGVDDVSEAVRIRLARGRKNDSGSSGDRDSLLDAGSGRPEHDRRARFGIQAGLASQDLDAAID